MFNKALFWIFVWFLKTWKKSSPLSEIYYSISSKRGVNIKIFRKYEQLCKKLSILKLDLFFFNKCLDLNLIPDFIRFKLPHLQAYKKPFQIYRSAINSHISMIQQERTKLYKETNHYSKLIQQQVSFFEFNLLMYRIKLSIKPALSNKLNKLNYKLFNLRKKHKLPSPDCLINHSDKSLSVSPVALQLRAPPKVSARAPAHRSYHFRGVKLKSCIKKIHHNLYISKQANVRIKHADTEGASHKKFGTDARVQ